MYEKAFCQNCRKEIYRTEGEDWKHEGSNNIICSYDYAEPIESTIIVVDSDENGSQQ